MDLVSFVFTPHIACTIFQRGRGDFGCVKAGSCVIYRRRVTDKTSGGHCGLVEYENVK